MNLNKEIYIENNPCLSCVFEPSKWIFKLKLQDDVVDSDLSVKELDDKDLLFLRKYANSHDLSTLRFYIFVNEKRPLRDIYTAIETVPEFLHVATSQIPGAGLGVFTKIDLPDGVSFGPYSGFLTKSQRCVRRFTETYTIKNNSGYAWTLQTTADGRMLWVDAKSATLSNWMRYVNCSRNGDEDNLKPWNFNDRNLFYLTTKPIRAGSELLICYGDSYAQLLNISVDETTGGPVQRQTNFN